MYELNHFGRLMKSMQSGEQKGWRSGFCWCARNARIHKCL